MNTNTQEIVKVPASESELTKFTRGKWQRSCIDGNRISFEKLTGKAFVYQFNYERSIANLLSRIAEAGYVVEPIYGPRGGKPRTWIVYKPCGKVE